jgi:hypothetical protein
LDVKVDCTGTKNCAQAVHNLNNRKGGQFKVKMGNDGKLKVDGKVDQSKLTKAEKALFDAISDKTKTATVNIVDNTGQSEFGTHDSKGVNTVDLENVSQMDAPSNKGGLNSGDVIAHEIMNAYYSLTMEANAADIMAAELYPGLFQPTDPQHTWNKERTDIVGSTTTQKITDGRGSERITIKFLTPIRGIEVSPLSGNSAERLNEIAHEAGSRVTQVTFVPK